MVEAVARMFARVANPEVLRVVPKILVEKKFVVVAAEPVAFAKVKFCRVEEPIERRLDRVARPEVFNIPAKRLVEKRLVEVAWVVVALTAVKFCNVVEPTTRRSPEEFIVEVPVPPTLS